ncbi:MAG: hypothetical protein ACKVQJ_00345 [Pyrinomonadaceae bacterium]
MATSKPPYNRSVFINCPFDDDYVPLFQAIIFTLFILDFTPRSAFEIDDGGIRLAKIIKIINGCKFGIHDISRTEPDLVNHLPRFNMPFELGLDIGCKLLSDRSRHREKVHLILDKDKHRFRIYLSDISGQDIKAHSDDPRQIIRVVRDWLRYAADHMPSATFVTKEYDMFHSQLGRICFELNLDHGGHTFVDYCHIVQTWLNERKQNA